MPDKSPEEDIGKIKDGTDQKGAPPTPVPPNKKLVDEVIDVWKKPVKPDTTKAPDTTREIPDQSAANKKEQDQNQLGNKTVAPDPVTEDPAQKPLPNLTIVDEGNGGPPGGGPTPPPPRRPPPDDPGQGSGPAPVPARRGPAPPETGTQAKEPPPSRLELQPAVSPHSDQSTARSK